jgi:hypothetical protein
VRNHSAFPAWGAVPFAPDRDIRFDYEISMGVRFGEKEWKETLDQWIAAHDEDVREILSSFLVPLLDAEGKFTADFSSSERLRAQGVPKQIPLAQPQQ